jgi:hypothetical protein
MKNTLLTLAIAAGLSLPAHAATLESATLNGNLLDTRFSTPSLIALDVSLLNNAALSFSFMLDADDVSRGLMDFNAIVRDVTGLGIGSLNVTLGGAPVTWTAGAVRAATIDGDLLDTGFFAGAPVTEFYFGNPFYEEGLTDWRIAFTGLNAGDRFTLDITTTPAVPEPREWMMMLGGLGMIVLSAARKLGR